MKRIDSQLRREADHRKVKGNSPFLCKIFSTIFPTTLNRNKGSLRLKVLSKIISLGFVDLNDKSSVRNFDELKFFNARATKKKVLDSFIDAGLIEKSGGGEYRKTNIGEAAWQSIIKFLETYKPIEQQVVEEGGKVYEHSLWDITVDEKGNCWTTRNFGMRNLGKEPIKEVEHRAFALNAKYPGLFTLQHSKNIQNYEITAEEEYSKKFKLNFKNPIKQGEYTEFWIRYNWPEQYSLNDLQWQFSYYSKISFVKEFMLKFNLPKNYELDEESLKQNNEGEPLPKDSETFDPIVINQSMIWRIRNVYPKRKYILAWRRKI